MLVRDRASIRQMYASSSMNISLAFGRRSAPIAIINCQALLRSGLPFIIDTWENEPNINEKVVEKALRASMHIAGYSVEGKRNATQMCLDAISEQFGLPKIEITKSRDHEIATNNNNSSEPWLAAISKALKASPTSFEALRKVYPLRGE